MLKKSESVSERRKYAFLAALCIVLLLPVGAKAGITGIFSLFQTMSSTLQQVGGTLNQLQNIKNGVTNLEQNIVWPLNQINQIKSFVFTNGIRARSLISRIQSVPVNSATLPNPAQFEFIVRGAQASSMGRMQTTFTQIYSPVSLASNAAPLDRNVMDMDDAAATGSLKTAVISDQATQQMLDLATTLEQQAATAAPGSAPLLGAQARVAELESQAYLTKLFAAQLRQEAVQLAHENALRKKSVDNNRTLRTNFQQILSTPAGVSQ